jgi:hypothetical protein
MRVLLTLVAVSFLGCGPSNRDGNAADSLPPDACSGFECRVQNCEREGKPPTTLSGTVFAPNGTLALYGATVYVPASEPGPLTEGAECSRCVDEIPGGSIGEVATSDEAGRFTLTNVPSGRNVPLVIQIGKWRRKVDILDVVPCTDNPVMPAQTSLPKNRNEGDMPRIAIATGLCDALECLIRKLGVDMSEFTNDTGPGRIHMYASNGANKFTDNTPFAPASTLWGNLDKLKQYDLTLFSCECSPQPAGKSQAAMDAMKAYADFGGRAFMSHYHNIWIAGDKTDPTHRPAVWPEIATCDTDTTVSGSDVIDQVANPKGTAFANWMLAVQGSTTLGSIPITEGKKTCTSIDAAKAERWVYFPGTPESPQVFQFTTPNELPKEERCGKVVFSDMHVASGSSSSSGTAFPNGCSSDPMTPQEKALAFMFFDISTCVGPLF